MKRKALLLLEQALSPRASVRSLDADEPYDAVIRMPGERQLSIVLEPWPHSRRVHHPDPSRIWILPGASEEVRTQLRSRQESFIDLRGAVYLCLPHLLIDRVGLKTPSRTRSAHRSHDPFADRSSLVLRTLLAEARVQSHLWGVRELADAAGVSPATASRVVHELNRLQVVDAKRRGRESAIRLTDARALFILWTGAYDWTKNQSIAFHAPMGDPIRFLRRSTSAFGKRRWALTLQAGTSLVAPHAAWERVHAYVAVEAADELLDIAESQGWSAADQGQLVLMKPYYRDSVWSGVRNVQELPVVSNLQLALDLWHYPLRGREQAEHIMNVQNLFK